MRRLRSRMGQLRGIARVDGKVVIEGTMTFALGPRSEAGAPFRLTPSRFALRRGRLPALRAPARHLLRSNEVEGTAPQPGAAVDGQHFTRDIARVIRHQERDGVRDLPGFPHRFRGTLG